MSDKELFCIVLIHATTKECRSVPVVHIANTYVSIRWGQSGIYDLNLAKNVLTARSQKAQRKGKAYWSAQDINAVRFMSKQHRAGMSEQEKFRESIIKHQANMPVPNPRIGNTGE